jgi:hypothetical protein
MQLMPSEEEDKQGQEPWQTVQYSDKQCIYSTSTVQRSAPTEIFCRAEVWRMPHRVLCPCMPSSIEVVVTPRVTEKS